ncbi:MAG: hypothetical protein ABI689_03260 [Thermoanaerobaculia bacterium]
MACAGWAPGLGSPRRWRDVLSPAAFGLIFRGAIYAVVGPEPFRAFVDYELPRLSSGEDFSPLFAAIVWRAATRPVGHRMPASGE